MRHILVSGEAEVFYHASLLGVFGPFFHVVGKPGHIIYHIDAEIQVDVTRIELLQRCLQAFFQVIGCF